MTIKLNTLERWTLVPEKGGVSLKSRGGRKVRVQFNSEIERRLYITRSSGEIRYLTTLPEGHSSLEFVDDGDLMLTAEDTKQGELWAYTSEMEPAHIAVPDPVIFTKIAHRRTRNPELEQMMFLMNQNIERRLIAADAEHARQLEALERKMKNGGVHGGAAAQREEHRSAEAGAVKPVGSKKRTGDAPGKGDGDASGASASGASSGKGSGQQRGAGGDAEGNRPPDTET